MKFDSIDDGGDDEYNSVGFVETLSKLINVIFINSRAPVDRLRSVKCYPGGRTIDLISSISEIPSQMGYHSFQYTERHLISLVSHC